MARAKTGWVSCKDPWTRAMTHTYGSWDPSLHPEGHGIMVFTDRVQDDFGRRRTQHTIKVWGGPYGETVDEETLPIGTRLGKAKAAALALAKEYEARGYLEGVD